MEKWDEMTDRRILQINLIAKGPGLENDYVYFCRWDNRRGIATIIEESHLPYFKGPISKLGGDESVR